MPEQLQNNYITNLNGPISSGDTTIVVDSAPTITGTFRIRIDDEIILVGSVSGLSYTGCTRGAEGTTATSHADNSTVTHVLTAGALSAKFAEVSGLAQTANINYLIDGGGAVIATGAKDSIQIPFACTITAVRLLADQTGSIVVDIWKDSYANYPPVDGDSITSSTPPTISSATKSQDTTLSGWTTTISAGDILRFNVDSCSSITKITVSITVTKT